MRHEFDTLEVMRELGVAPSTACVVAGLLNGQTDPDNFRSVQVWAMKQFGNLPPQVDKILTALCQLLGSPHDTFVTWNHTKYVELDTEGELPTVIWNDKEGRFCLSSVVEYMRNR